MEFVIAASSVDQFSFVLLHGCA